MSDDHKAALAEGRRLGRAVREYLDALEAHKPKRGRKRTPESIQKRIDEIESDLAAASPLRRLQLFQERLDLTTALENASHGVDLAGLEDAFIAAAGPYSERKGISYAAWREFGIDASILKRANISRGRYGGRPMRLSQRGAIAKR